MLILHKQYPDYHEDKEVYPMRAEKEKKVFKEINLQMQLKDKQITQELIRKLLITIQL